VLLRAVGQLDRGDLESRRADARDCARRVHDPRIEYGRSADARADVEELLPLGERGVGGNTLALVDEGARGAGDHGPQEWQIDAQSKQARVHAKRGCEISEGRKIGREVALDQRFEENGVRVVRLYIDP
jgi:hypothetical protein